MEKRLRIIVTGLIAEYPLGGLTWHYLQYLLGLDRLGHDVYYVEDTGNWPYNPVEGGAASDGCRFNVDYLGAVMSRFGMHDRWAYHFAEEARWYGMSDRRRRDVVGSADLLINVSGTLGRPLDYRQIPKMVYVDTDPVFAQIKLEQREQPFHSNVLLHDVFFTFGECLAGLPVEGGQRWLPTRQPVVVSRWSPSLRNGGPFTTVMNWTSYQDVVHNGRCYGQKDVELKRFLGLPHKVAPTVLELAIAAGHTDSTPMETLRQNDWKLVDPTLCCASVDSYREYIESSKAEFSVAKQAYVAGLSGWFSERSACYLAAGRPVLLQDTGYSRILPTGCGLLPFRDEAEAVAAIREIEADYERHARGARAIAEECFDSDRVLGRLLEAAC